MSLPGDIGRRLSVTAGYLRVLSSTILGLLGDRETADRQAADQIRAQITTLTHELTQIDAELAALATTRSTLRALTPTEFTTDDPTVISSAYQQILAALGTAITGMCAEDVCRALNIDPLPKHIEGARAKLKRLVTRELVAETKPGTFTLAPKRT